MKGAIWEFWFFGLIGAVITIIIFFSFTPFINQLTDSVSAIGNFSQAPNINVSFHEALERNTTLWNLWPLAGLGLIFLIFFIGASEDRDNRRL
jgi:hypothetical protein